MTAPARSRCRARYAAIAALLMASPAAAQMIPVTDLREIAASATYQGVDDDAQHFPTAPFVKFEDWYNALVENDHGHSQAFAFQSSEFFPAAIYGSGQASGDWDGEPSGDYLSWSLLRMQVRWDNCLQYDLDANIAVADAAPEIEIRSATGAGKYVYLNTDGHFTNSGRLPAGDYVFDCKSSAGVNAPYFNGGAWEFTWLVQSCVSLIATHPQNASAATGGMASFIVTPAGPAPAGPSSSSPSAATYQWRKNLAPLSDNGHFSGVTSNELTITGVAAADTGYYDVVLTDGSIVEPSRLARLSVTGTTDVEIPPGVGSELLSLQGAMPNPSRTGTSFRYDARKPMRVRATIYDAAGRAIRQIADRLISGPGALSWDGATASGAATGPGIYFLRVAAEGQVFVRRFARVL